MVKFKFECDEENNEVNLYANGCSFVDLLTCVTMCVQSVYNNLNPDEQVQFKDSFESIVNNGIMFMTDYEITSHLRGEVN